jgi:hypothetical protein
VHGPARRASEAYRRAVNTKDLTLLRTIFAEGATLGVPAALTPGDPSGSFRGVEDVMGFFSKVSFPDRAVLGYDHVYEDGATCIVELIGHLPERDVEALDVFTDDDGLVVRMAVYARVT